MTVRQDSRRVIPSVSEQVCNHPSISQAWRCCKSSARYGTSPGSSCKGARQGLPSRVPGHLAHPGGAAETIVTLDLSSEPADSTPIIIPASLVWDFTSAAVRVCPARGAAASDQRLWDRTQGKGGEHDGSTDIREGVSSGDVAAHVADPPL